MKLLRITLAGSILLPFIFTACIPQVQAQSPNKGKSQWVYTKPDGKLGYKTLDKGDKIMDFSSAGYMGGGVSIPSPTVKVTLNPINGDNTSAIQNAIDQVSKMELVNGLRGTVLLNKGIYNCEGAININASGVVLRGSGSGTDGTIINMTGGPHLCIAIKGTVAEKVTGTITKIADSYVPSGSLSFNVADASGLAVGDMIRITRPVTDTWVQFMGMDQLSRNGKKETWVKGDITTDRVISKIEDKKITLDIPLSDSYDAAYIGNATIAKIKTSGEVSQIGVESFRIIAPEQSVAITDGLYRALNIKDISDGWARDLDINNTTNSIGVSAKRITIESVNILHSVATKGAAKPADLGGDGSQLLFSHCTIKGDQVFFFATGAKVTGPIVLLNCVFRGNGWIQPHQRWATGLLVDNCQVPDGGIDFMNRGEMGSGHGWAIGWAVAWNCQAASYLNQQPPGAANWVIGSKGDHDRKPMPVYPHSANDPLQPEGIYDSSNTPVAPNSLYLAQLAERLGQQAVKNIGY